jgi:sugar (pentulose or hexulose) kinase
LLKACLEGVTLRIGAIIKLLQKTISKATTDEPQIIASGTALEANVVWRQMLANCANLCLIYDDETHHSTSRGVVVMLDTSSTQGMSKTTGVMLETVNMTTVCMPMLQAQAYWKHAAETQNKFIDAISPLYEDC